MASTLNTRATVLNQGVVYVGAHAGGKIRPLGENELLELVISEKSITLHDHLNAAGGSLDQVRRIQKIMVKLKLRDFRPENLALALLGQEFDGTSGTIVGASHVAYRGGYLPLAHVDPSGVVVTRGATTLVAGIDYMVMNAGLVILDSAVNVADGETILVDYDHGEHTVVQAMTTIGNEVRLLFDGANEAGSGKAAALDLYRVRLGLTDSLNLLGNDLGTLELTGTLLADATRGGDGESSYFNLILGA